MGGFLKNPLLNNSFLTRPLRINKSRLSALGLLLAVVAVLYFSIAAPLISLSREYRETSLDLRFRLERLRRTAAEKPTLMQTLENLKLEGQEGEQFLARNTAALASAELQTQIKEIVGNAGGELTSTQVIPARNEENFTRVAVKVRVNGSTEVLRAMLYNFESAQPFLFIEDTNVRPIRMPRNPADKNPQLPDRLSVDFDVVGYMRTE